MLHQNPWSSSLRIPQSTPTFIPEVRFVFWLVKLTLQTRIRLLCWNGIIYFRRYLLYHITGDLSAKKSAYVELCASGTQCAFPAASFLNFLKVRVLLFKTL
jgi:hypothetical protein